MALNLAQTHTNRGFCNKKKKTLFAQLVKFEWGVDYYR